MSNQVFPSLIGLGFNVVRAAEWSSLVQRAVSGRTTRVAYWSSPIWHWTLTYEFLRSDSNAEFQALAGFFNARQAQFDPFLYTDADDFTVTGQSLGLGTGSKTAFQLVRTLGGFAEPILAPNTVLAVYIDGVLKTLGSDYSISTWGAAVPGVVTFTSAPGGGSVITADFTYYFPVAFDNDTMTFNKFMTSLYDGKVAFSSLK